MTGVFMKGWISLHDDCTIDYRVYADITEFTLGGRNGPELVTTERGLETLIAKSTAALAEMRARTGDPGEQQ